MPHGIPAHLPLALIPPLAPTPCRCPLQDFRARIRKYEDGYETIMDRTLHYIKLIDMVTGRCRGSDGGKPSSGPTGSSWRNSCSGLV